MIKSGGAKSFVRLKVYSAMFVAFILWAYLLWAMIMLSGNYSELPPKQLIATLLLFGAILYVRNIKCERCKSIWNSFPYAESKKSLTLKEFLGRFVSQMDLTVDKKCRVCGLERY